MPWIRLKLERFRGVLYDILSKGFQFLNNIIYIFIIFSSILKKYKQVTGCYFFKFYYYYLLLFYIDLIYYRTYGFEISIGRFEREISILRKIPYV